MNRSPYCTKWNHQTTLPVVLMVLLFILSACGSANTNTPSPTVSELNPTLAVTTSAQLTATVTATITSTREPSPLGYDPALPDSWKNLPVIPETISQYVRDLYESGKTSGLDQHAFSKVGDCETSTDYFLAPFGLSEKGYRLGEYTSLASVIAYYHESFARVSLAAKSSFSAASVLSPLWADASHCRVNESPLICEIRLHKPAIMFVMLGTNDVKTSSRDEFEINLKHLLKIAIANNVVPVLVTKADNLEGDGSINAIIARVAWENELPVMNLWRAMKDLPNGGLKPDQIHLTYAQPFFDYPENMLMGWPIRNLTTLQMLEFLHNQLEP